MSTSPNLSRCVEKGQVGKIVHREPLGLIEKGCTSTGHHSGVLLGCRVPRLGWGLRAKIELMRDVSIKFMLTWTRICGCRVSAFLGYIADKCIGGEVNMAGVLSFRFFIT